MSIDFPQWHLLLEPQLRKSFQSFLTNTFSSLSQSPSFPSYLGPVNLESFEFYGHSPEVELIGLGDVWKEFREADEEEEEREKEEKRKEEWKREREERRRMKGKEKIMDDERSGLGRTFYNDDDGDGDTVGALDGKDSMGYGYDHDGYPRHYSSGKATRGGTLSPSAVRGAPGPGLSGLAPAGHRESLGPPSTTAPHRALHGSGRGSYQQPRSSPSVPPPPFSSSGSPSTSFSNLFPPRPGVAAPMGLRTPSPYYNFEAASGAGTSTNPLGRLPQSSPGLPSSMMGSRYDPTEPGLPKPGFGGGFTPSYSPSNPPAMNHHSNRHPPPPHSPSSPNTPSQSQTPPLSLQLHLHVSSTVPLLSALSLNSSLTVNNPSPGFMSLPLRILVREVRVECEVVVGIEMGMGIDAGRDAPGDGTGDMGSTGGEDLDFTGVRVGEEAGIGPAGGGKTHSGSNSGGGGGRIYWCLMPLREEEEESDNDEDWEEEETGAGIRSQSHHHGSGGAGGQFRPGAPGSKFRPFNLKPQQPPGPTSPLSPTSSIPPHLQRKGTRIRPNREGDDRRRRRSTATLQQTPRASVENNTGKPHNPDNSNRPSVKPHSQPPSSFASSSGLSPGERILKEAIIESEVGGGIGLGPGIGGAAAGGGGGGGGVGMPPNMTGSGSFGTAAGDKERMGGTAAGTTNISGHPTALRNVGKVEKFLLEMMRNRLEAEVCWPNFQTIVFGGSGNDNNQK